MGFVYLINIEKTDFYKIGITKRHPEKRLKALQTGCPNKLVLVSTYSSVFYKKIEKFFHRILKHKKYIEDDFNHLKGEWFILNEEDVLGFVEKCFKIEETYKFVETNSTLSETFFK
jgi:hypothetical protein